MPSSHLKSKQKMEESLHIVTPTLFSERLSELIQRPVYLKMDALQPSGSFKNRGMGALVKFYKEQGFSGIVSSSGGNAGLAAAYAARLLGLKAKIVAPQTSFPFMLEKIRKEGAEVIVKGEVWSKANHYAKEFAEELQYGFAPPYDHPAIWEGNATLIHEVFAEGEKPGAVVLSVGGGGLLSGVAAGLHAVGWKDVPIIAAETEGAASFHAAIQAGQVVTLEKMNTVALSLACPRVTERAFEWTKEHTIHSLTVTDKEALSASLRFADDQRVMVEPACGAALAVLYENRPILQDYRSILVVVCGGNLVNRSLMNDWQKNLSR